MCARDSECAAHTAVCYLRAGAKDRCSICKKRHYFKVKDKNEWLNTKRRGGRVSAGEQTGHPPQSQPDIEQGAAAAVGATQRRTRAIEQRSAKG